MFCRRKAAVVLQKVAKDLRFDWGQYGSFAVFAVYLRCSAVLCSRRTGRESQLEPH